ncbi:MAG: hypothetical protein JJT85_03780 [Chromatiales bacterium]|nr:hypothetical protein [Chromatiales bacterium]
MSVYVPPFRVDLRQWCAWSGSEWDKIRDVVGHGFRLMGPNQSVYTMAANAVLRLIERFDVDPSRVRFLALGTESSTDNSAGAIIVKGMVDTALRAKDFPPLSRNCEVPEFKHACLGGVYALKSALRFLATDGPEDLAIVVCADKALYARGSSGEPTQGAGAVAMLLGANPGLVSIDLRAAGTASDYRGVDFRKPLVSRTRVNGSVMSLDIPIYNGRYSTNCYVDEIQRALEDMYRRRGLDAIEYIRSVDAVFMHRPYQRMPETGWGLAYLFALAQGSERDRDELAGYCRGAGLDVADVIREMRSEPELGQLAVAERIAEDIFPLSLAILKVFRKSEAFARYVRGKMLLGADYMQELGNLYTGALPAWLAAGFSDASERGLDLAGQEVLALGYGSGDAADAIPMRVVSGWEQAAARIRVAEALEGSTDLTAEQYAALREGTSPDGLTLRASAEFIIERVGNDTGHAFQDDGIEYYRYVH